MYGYQQDVVKKWMRGELDVVDTKIWKIWGKYGDRNKCISLFNRWVWEGCDRWFKWPIWRFFSNILLHKQKEEIAFWTRVSWPRYRCVKSFLWLPVTRRSFKKTLRWSYHLAQGNEAIDAGQVGLAVQLKSFLPVSMFSTKQASRSWWLCLVLFFIWNLNRFPIW